MVTMTMKPVWRQPTPPIYQNLILMTQCKIIMVLNVIPCVDFEYKNQLNISSTQSYN